MEDKEELILQKGEQTLVVTSDFIDDIQMWTESLLSFDWLFSGIYDVIHEQPKFNSARNIIAIHKLAESCKNGALHDEIQDHSCQK